MFDPNTFKRSVKEWMRVHPEGTEADLQDFCEEQIPATHYAANQWLVEHTVSWYRHVLTQRQAARAALDDGDDGDDDELAA